MSAGLILDRARLYVLISALETDLRAHIREWLVPNLDGPSLFRARFEEISRRALVEGRDATDAFDGVEYIDWGDGFTTLNSHAMMLPEDLRDAVRGMNSQFEAAVGVRNRVMHSRPLLPDDDTLVLRLAQELLSTSASWPTLRSALSRLQNDPLWAPEIGPMSGGPGIVQNNLPLPEFDETGLLGRARENGRLVDYLLAQRYPVVTLVGEGGIGKTALAVKALYDLVDHPDCPYLAVVWVSLKTERLTGQGIQALAATTADITGIAAAIGDPLSVDAQPGLGELGAFLADIPTLIAIDNIETANSDEIVDLIESLPPSVRFLLTSRVGLGQLERRVDIGALDYRWAERMFRVLADRRGLTHLARAKQEHCERIIHGLRASPLGIRWFIEAVDAGGQPDDLLSQPDLLLKFCMSSIYDSLSSETRKLAVALLGADRPVPVSELVVVLREPRDKIVKELHELQRRSLVTVQNARESVGQLYGLSAMARQYLELPGGDDAVLIRELTARRTALMQAEETRSRAARRSVFSRGSYFAASEAERAVCVLLQEASVFARRGDREAAAARIEQARDAAPEYFEVYRVAAMLEADLRPEEARRLYQRAYELAPEEGKGIVAYWMSGLLARKLFDLAGAEELALEAHERLDLPDTALRLGRIRVWMEKFEEGEELIRQSIARADNARTRVIAHTDLLDLGKRRVERLWGEERRPGDAVREGVVALREGLDFALGGVVDVRLHQILAELLNEIGNATARVNVAGSVDDEIVALLEKVQAWLPSAEAYGVGADVKGTLARLGNAPGLSEDVKQTVAYLLREPGRRAGGSVRTMGYIKRFSQAKGFGFIASADYPDNLFFSRDAIVGGAGDAVTLVANAPVSFRIGENERGPCAEAVRCELGDDGRPEALRKRTGRITSVEFSYCFAEERDTQVDIFIHKSSFADPADWESIGRGEEVAFDIEMSARGLVAVKGSVRRVG